jgi:glycosyltransferase involved in cell wall biosynthesis
LYNKYYYRTINKIAKLRVLGPEIEEYLRATKYKNIIKIIDNGINIPSRKKLNKHPVFNLLYFGAISESKGFGRFLDVAELLSQISNLVFKIVVIGEWANKRYELRMQELLRDRELIQHFNFKGRLTGDSKWRELCNCNLHIHLTDYDGQPMTIIETMGLGIPCIATKVGAIPQLIINGVNGYLVDFSTNQISELISELYTNKNKYDALSRNSRKIYEPRFTEEIYLNNMYRFLESV